MIRTIKVMLIPNNRQKTKLFQYAGAARYAYNWTLEAERANRENGGKFISDVDLRRIFTQHKAEPGKGWLFTISNNVTKQAIKDACEAFKRNMGYQLFQGFLFGKPEVVTKRLPPIVETSHGKLLWILRRILFEDDQSDIQWPVECARVIDNNLLLSYLFPREAHALPPPHTHTYKCSRKYGHGYPYSGVPYGTASPAPLGVPVLYAA